MSKFKFFPFYLNLFFCLFVIGTHQAKAQTEAELNPDGIIVPRLDTNAVSVPREGQLIYSPSTDCYWFRNTNKWQKVSTTNLLIDADEDTKVVAEDYIFGDEIQFFVEGTEVGSFRGVGAAQRLHFESSQTIIGHNAGNNNLGASNVFVGDEVGLSTTTGGINTFIGARAGRYNKTGTWNTFIGAGAGRDNRSGDSTVAVGYLAGGLDTLNHNSVYIGAEAGYGGPLLASPAVKRSGNVCIGYKAGKLETGSNRLYIENSPADSSTALIYGKFDDNSITFNGKVGIGTTDPIQVLDIVDTVINGPSIIRHVNPAPASSSNAINLTYRLNTDDGSPRVSFQLKNNFDNIVNGNQKSKVLFQTQEAGNLATTLTLNGSDIGIGTESPSTQLHTTGTIRFASLGMGTVNSDSDGNLSVSSDIRLKNIKQSFTKGLAEIQQLEPIIYQWNNQSGLSTKELYAGFSAQNVQEVIPEAVGIDQKGFLTLSDRPIIAALVNSIKELVKENEHYQTELSTLRQDVALLKQMILNQKN